MTETYKNNIVTPRQKSYVVYKEHLPQTMHLSIVRQMDGFSTILKSLL